MSRCKVRDEDLKELAGIYNIEGKRAVYELLSSSYKVKHPYFIIRRMREHSDLSYNPENDAFEIEKRPNQEKVFMSMDELCSPVIPQRINTQETQESDSRPAAMDKLIRELIGDRLLELSKYVTIDSLSKKIIVDKTTLTTDGYQMITH